MFPNLPTNSPLSLQQREGLFKTLITRSITSWLSKEKKTYYTPQRTASWHSNYSRNIFQVKNKYNKEGFLRETPKKGSSSSKLIVKEGRGDRKMICKVTHSRQVTGPQKAVCCLVCNQPPERPMKPFNLWNDVSAYSLTLLPTLKTFSSITPKQTLRKPESPQ